MARMKREIREARAILMAEHALARRLNTIAFEEEVLYPALERVADGTLKVGLKDGAVEKKELKPGDVR